MFPRKLIALAVAGIVAIPLLNCAEPATSPQAAEVEAALLRQRAKVVYAAVKATPAGPTAEQVREIGRLTADIRSWQARTGRTDVGVTEGPLVQPEGYEPGGGATVQLRKFCFGTCPRTPTIEPVGKLCVLTSSSCVNGVWICRYTCVDIQKEA